MNKNKIRYFGYVVGSRFVGNDKKVWTVKVDDDSEENDIKFEVETTYIILSKGLRVSFELGTFHVYKKKIRKAIEVMAE